MQGVLRQTEPAQPNHVLLDDPRYRRVWQARQEIIRRERAIDDLWRWQRRSWAEFCKATVAVSLIWLDGVRRFFAAPLSARAEHRRGYFLVHDDPMIVVAHWERGWVAELLSGNSDVVTATYTPSFWERKSELDGGQRETFRALRSDGCLPDPIGGHPMPANAGDELDRTLAKLENDLAALKGYFGQQIEPRVLSDVLGFASWCFWRCPSSIADVFLGTYEERYSYGINSTLLCEGVARVVEGENQLRRYFTGLEKRLHRKRRMVKPDSAGLARVLGTSDEAAVHLNPPLAERIVDETVETLQDENRKAPSTCYKMRFKTALRMLAALLRHRQTRRDFLDPDHDLAARRLLAALDTAEERNVDLAARIEQSTPLHHGTTRTLSRTAKRFHANAEVIGDLKGFIRREGGNPNIIQRIDMLDDE